MELEEFKRTLRDKTAFVIGLGKFGGGTGVIKFLSPICKKVVVCDQKAPDEFKDMLNEISLFNNIEFKFGEHKREDFENKDIIILNPSVMLHSNIYEWAKITGKPIFTEITLFFSLCKAKKIGITGTLGKSTFCSTLFNVLNSNLPPTYRRCWLGGNIGGSLLPYLDLIEEHDLVILEISSFQLQYFPHYQLSPYISVVLNLCPDHLDKHLSFDEYSNAKMNLVRYQKNDDFCILNLDNDKVAQFKEKTRARVYNFSKTKKVIKGTFIENDNVYFTDGNITESVFNLNNIKSFFIHLDTILALITVCKILNVESESILEGINSSKNLPHRLEFIGEFKGRKFINDSNATTPQASIFGLEIIQGPKIVICGGKNKNVDYLPLCEKLAKNAKAVVLIGETTPIFEQLIKKINNNIPVFKSNNLKEAVISAYNISSENDYIILSPGTSSLDMFANFAERGNEFKKCFKEFTDGKFR